MTQVRNFPYDTLEVGQQARLQRTVEERDIQLFAAVSGDRNPVHLDAEYAAASLFKERIAHGMFSGALISAAIACELPGPGTIYLGQQLKFTRPVKLGDQLTVSLRFWKSSPRAACAWRPASAIRPANWWSTARPKYWHRVKR